jgi:hypothetical protein
VHFLLLLLEMLLDRLIPTWRNGLTMAVRRDGKIEQVPMRPGWWDRWVSWLTGTGGSAKPRKKKVRAARATKPERHPGAAAVRAGAVPDVV